MKDIFDVTIIGGGPTGLFAAYYSGFRGLRTKILDSQPDLGGQITALYPDKFIYDVAGFPKILGKDLVRNLVEQAMQYTPEVLLNESVQTVDDEGEKVLALRADGTTHYSHVTLITAGIGAFTPKTFKRPDIDKYLGKGLHYAVKRKEDFRGSRSAVSWFS